MFCRYCGKEIDDRAVVCVHCGVPTDNHFQQQAAPLQPVESKKVNAFGIAGLAVSIVSLWLGILFCIVPITGLALSIVGMVNMKKYRLKGLAIAGLVVGIASVVFWALAWLIAGMSLLTL